MITLENYALSIQKSISMNTNTKKKLDNKYNPYNLFLET